MINHESNSKSSFNEEFCTKLEYRICSELEKSNDSELKGFWCDGILWKLSNESQLKHTHINDKKQIITNAWIGKTGQEKFKTIIHFGEKALKQYAKGTNLTESIPDLESKTEWIEIDKENKIIEIKLD